MGVRITVLAKVKQMTNNLSCFNEEYVCELTVCNDVLKMSPKFDNYGRSNSREHKTYQGHKHGYDGYLEYTKQKIGKVNQLEGNKKDQHNIGEKTTKYKT